MAGLPAQPESSPDYPSVAGTASPAEGEISSSESSAVEEGPKEGPWEDLRHDPEGLRAVLNVLELRLAGYTQGSEKGGESFGDGSGGDSTSGLSISAVERSMRVRNRERPTPSKVHISLTFGTLRSPTASCPKQLSLP